MKERESRYIRVARIAYRIAQESPPVYTHPKSPHHYTFPQLAACVLLMFYLDLPYRDMEEWLLAGDRIQQVLGLRRVPDHSTLQRTYARLRMRDLEAMKTRLLEEAGVEEEGIATDSTGYPPGQASQYYQTRSGRRYQRWVKGVYAVGIEQQMIVACGSGCGLGSDAGYLKRLRRGVGGFGWRQGRRRARVLLADAGFDGGQVEAGDVIPPIRRGSRLVSRGRQERAELVAQARVDGLYSQRWKVETVHSVIKRKFGERIRSRSYWLRYHEPIIKGLVYNLHR